MSARPRRMSWSSLVALAVLAVGSLGCQGAGAPAEPPAGLLDPATVVVQATVAATNVTLVTVAVSGDGIATPVVAPLALSAGVATGSVKAPPGPARLLTVRGYDAQGVETHRGVLTTALAEGQEVRLAVSVGALSGSIAIEVRLGEYAITIAGAPTSLAVGATARATASVVGPSGAALPTAAVVWGSSNASVASVDAAGNVAALRAGTTTLVASYKGFAAAAPLVVAP